MVNERGWGHLLVVDLRLLDDRLLVARCVRGSGLWKLKAISLAVGARTKPQPFEDDHSLHCCLWISSQELH